MSILITLGSGLTCLMFIAGDSSLHTEHTVSGNVTALFGVILALMVFCLAFEEKLHAKSHSLLASLLLFPSFSLPP